MNTTPRSCWSGAARPFHPFGWGLFMLLSALLLALPFPASAAPGDLDPSFDGDGKVLTDFRGFEEANALVVQPDGKLVAAGYSATIDGSAFALARYNPDGSLDKRFGDRGHVVTPFGQRDFAVALVVQTDGKLVAAGGKDLFTGRSDFALARYNPNGSLDRRFGDAGRVVTDLGRHDIPIALVLQPDGKLVLLGRTTGGTTLVRYSPDGRLDASFGVSGVVVTEARSAGALILQPDGKLVLGARPLARFNVDGTLDTSFGVGGFTFGSTAFPLTFRTAMALLPDGKLVAAGGNFPGDVALERFSSDGSPDTSFGTGGLVVISLGEGSAPTSLLVQPDGRLVALGGVGRVGNRHSLLVRYQPDGSLDTSFGGGGFVRTDMREPFFGAALVRQPDGKLIVGGESRVSGDSDFALARYVTTEEPLAVAPTCGGWPATILGTSRKDTIRGTRGPDVILGLGGNDTIRGLAGNDTICGGRGRDTLIGGGGKDRLLGEDGDDKLFGDKGRDSLDGGSGRDACRTGETARRCEGEPASSKPTSGERPKDPPKPPCPPISNFPCS